MSNLCVIALMTLILTGCHNGSKLPDTKTLTDSLAQSILEGDEIKLNRCFVEMDNSPEGLQRKGYVIAIINELFPNETPHRSVVMNDISFERGEDLQGTLSITNDKDELKQYQTHLKVRMSISGWKIASLSLAKLP